MSKRAEAVGDIVSRAADRHRAGDLAGAFALYQEALRRDPHNVDALHLSGLILAAGPDAEEGITRVRRAIKGALGEPAFHDNLRRLLTAKGRLDEAARAVGEFARLAPNAPQLPGALSGVADALYDAERPAEALPLYTLAARRTDALEPAFNRAACLSDLGRGEEAGRAFAAALLRDPRSPQAAARLAASRQGDERALVRAFLLNPGVGDFAMVVSALRAASGRFEGALSACRAALPLSPADTGAWSNLPIILSGLGRNAEATVAGKRAVRLSPLDAGARLNLGAAAVGAGDFPLAETVHRQACSLSPADASLWRGLGNVLAKRSRHDVAARLLERGLATAQGEEIARLRSNLGVTLMAIGRTGEATVAFRAALAVTPGDLEIRSNLLFCLCFDPDVPADEVFAEHRAFERRVPGAPFPRVPAGPRADGRIRVGYVSPDLQRWPGPGFHFLTPLIENHDRDVVSIVLYHTDVKRDAVTERLFSAADLARAAGSWGDERLAAQIADDRIDILVDCDGHMSRNRMALFARRAAPIQVSFPLCPNTSGLSAMDYQLTDDRLTPDWMDRFASEARVRLPGSILCYRPAPSTFAPPERDPWETAGRPVFACFNNPAKLDARTFDVWARILKAAPELRLRLKWRGMAEGPGARALAEFARLGVEPGRIDPIGVTPDPYEAYTRVDLCLDPLFAAGGTTTCDALWMGVPTLTLAGGTMIGRWGVSLNAAVGLTELIAGDEETYIGRAVDLARRPELIRKLRAGLRQRVAASPLMDERGYARAIEVAYRTMIERATAGRPPAPFEVTR